MDSFSWLTALVSNANEFLVEGSSCCSRPKCKSLQYFCTIHDDAGPLCECEHRGCKPIRIYRVTRDNAVKEHKLQELLGDWSSVLQDIRRYKFNNDFYYYLDRAGRVTKPNAHNCITCGRDLEFPDPAIKFCCLACKLRTAGFSTEPPPSAVTSTSCNNTFNSSLVSMDKLMEARMLTFHVPLPS